MFLIGVAGGTGSGKTFIAHKIAKIIGNAQVISTDNYYKSNFFKSEAQRESFDFDNPKLIDWKLLEKQLITLKQGKAVNMPVYSFKLSHRLKKTIKVKPAKALIIEGLFVLYHPKIRQILDLKIFVSAGGEMRLIRRIRRDIEDRGQKLDEVLDRYEKFILRAHRKYVEPTKRYADFLIYNIENKKPDLTAIKKELRKLKFI